MCDCEKKTSLSHRAESGEQMQAVFQEAGRKAFLASVSSAARKAVAGLPEPGEIEKLSGPVRVLQEQVARLILSAIHAADWSDAQLDQFRKEFGWARLGLQMGVIARSNDNRGEGTSAHCEDLYDTCMVEHNCSYSWLCLCCIPCEFEYAGCMLKILRGGIGISIA